MGGFPHAVVAYLPGELSGFIDALRRRLNPEFASWTAHVTILPPRLLHGSPEEALSIIRQKSSLVEPFEVGLESVSTFWPVTGVVYLSFGKGVERLVQLHDTLNCGSVAQQEIYAYVPHVTVSQGLDETRTQNMLAEISAEWRRFAGDLTFRIESLRLVEQTSANCWVDLAPIPLGTLLAPIRK